MNYNGSQVGVPYVRCPKITIHYLDRGQKPIVVIDQALAVKLADGTVYQLEEMKSIQVELDLVADAHKTFPLINPEDDSPLNAETDLQTVYLQNLAAVRHIQKSQE